MKQIKQSNNYRKRLIVAQKHRFFPIEINDIACFILEDSILYAVTFNHDKYYLNRSLERVEQELDKIMYFRVNRNIIVNIEAIDYFENYFKGRLILKLKNNLHEHILVSKNKAAAFKDWLKN